MGRVKSERKTAAVRENAKRPRLSRRKPLDSFPCSCPPDTTAHRASCLRGRALKRRNAAPE